MKHTPAPTIYWPLFRIPQGLWVLFQLCIVGTRSWPWSIFRCTLYGSSAWCHKKVEWSDHLARIRQSKSHILLITWTFLRRKLLCWDFWQPYLWLRPFPFDRTMLSRECMTGMGRRAQWMRPRKWLRKLLGESGLQLPYIWKAQPKDTAHSNEE